MDAKREPQVINPPNLLLAKVPKIGGPSMANIVKVAEAELSKINANYEAIVQTDLRKINDAISRATGTPTSAAVAIREISGISHDIKGQAASLGYPLLTEIAQSLCHFISTDEAAAIMGLM